MDVAMVAGDCRYDFEEKALEIVVHHELHVSQWWCVAVVCMSRRIDCDIRCSLIFAWDLESMTSTYYQY